MMAAEKQSRPQFDWSARVRTTAMEALRYSRFVALMKKLLSTAAFLIIAAVLVFFFIQRQPRQLQLAYERLGSVKNDLAMVKPRLTGADAKGNPFVITADMAVQDAHNARKATLRNVEADLSLDKNGWLNARAKSGMVDTAAGRLELGGGIDVFTDTGFELHTSGASMDLKQSIIQGRAAVTGQGPNGTLRADSFHADRKTDLLTLVGHVQMTLIGTHK